MQYNLYLYSYVLSQLFMCMMEIFAIWLYLIIGNESELNL